jgi:hypothetical protein
MPLTDQERDDVLIDIQKRVKGLEKANDGLARDNAAIGQNVASLIDAVKKLQKALDDINVKSKP